MLKNTSYVCTVYPFTIATWRVYSKLCSSPPAVDLKGAGWFDFYPLDWIDWEVILVLMKESRINSESPLLIQQVLWELRPYILVPGTGTQCGPAHFLFCNIFASFWQYICWCVQWVVPEQPLVGSWLKWIIKQKGHFTGNSRQMKDNDDLTCAAITEHKEKINTTVPAIEIEHRKFTCSISFNCRNLLKNFW